MPSPTATPIIVAMKPRRDVKVLAGRPHLPSFIESKTSARAVRAVSTSSSVE